MRFVGKAKIGKLSAKGITYPQLRLPPNYSDSIGQVADVIETEHDGKRAFLIVPNNNTVLKPIAEVLKLDSQDYYVQRLQELELEIKGLRSRIFAEDNSSDDEIKKTGTRSGPGRIRTGDLRRVKATS